MFKSIEAIQAQQLYKVQPVSLYEQNNDQRNNSQQAMLTGFIAFSGKTYNPFYPSVENSPTLARSIDLLG